MQALVKARKIGGSIGVIIPNEIVEQERINIKDILKIDVERKDNFNSLWGILKDVKVPTKKIMKIIDEGEEIG